MKLPEIAVIDYGMGNLRSVAKALERAGAKAVVTSDARKVLASSGVVFPGVGAFGPAKKNIDKHGMAESIRGTVAAGKPFLGLCLGFQLLFERSCEDGTHGGFGVIPGEVNRFGYSGASRRLKVPHMGWNRVFLKNRDGSRMFKGIPDKTYFYFVHSYYGVPSDKSWVSGVTEYGKWFCSAVEKENVWACQFHPEKSSANGLKILKNFVNEVKKC
ncbi:MAG: imidazole glycerol phosphate synthase subunit HisH [Endomicrobiales bacterium]|nr:imidazole glycerol phosphate synthase subunit HisH [Endomicrobiales bacterium]